ncbi:hypothetical protein [Variovorax soli]|uniref:hypothetical protein n=1 Tax=Variovorax soli TaxID=376815 RepID=UPI001FDEAE3D|nr:hypothetical protein [Variovorax soli]
MDIVAHGVDARSMCNGYVPSNRQPATIVQIDVAIHDRVFPNLQTTDMEKADTALQGRSPVDVKGAQAVQRRPQKEGQASMQAVQQGKAHKIALINKVSNCLIHC